MSYDPMTLLSPAQMDKLVEWWKSGASEPLTLGNQSLSGGSLSLVADAEGVWITPTP